MSSSRRRVLLCGTDSVPQDLLAILTFQRVEGYQILFEASEESPGSRGLEHFAGQVVRFPESDLKVPHMGWNQVAQKHSHPLWQDIEDGSRFYFVHSYYVDPADSTLVAGTTDYGIEFVSVIARDNVFAAQFHPEKSSRVGGQILKNFIEL